MRYLIAVCKVASAVDEVKVDDEHPGLTSPGSYNIDRVHFVFATMTGAPERLEGIASKGQGRDRLKITFSRVP